MRKLPKSPLCECKDTLARFGSICEHCQTARQERQEAIQRAKAAYPAYEPETSNKPLLYCNICLTTVGVTSDKQHRGHHICFKCQLKRTPARQNNLAASYGTRLTPKTQDVNRIY